MRTRYQRAFDHVTASRRLREEVLNMTKQEKRSLRRRIPRAVLIAAALALLLAGTALAMLLETGGQDEIFYFLLYR